MSDINLLPVEEKASDLLSSFQKKLTVLSIIILVVVALFTVLTLVMFTGAKSTEANLKVRVEKAASDVNSNQMAEELLTVIGKKSEAASKILSSRLVYTNILEDMAGLMPTGVYFSDFKVSGSKLTTSAKAKTSADVANLVSSFVTTAEGKKLFSSVSIDSLGTDKDGNYTFTVSMQVNQARAPDATDGAQETN